jgi:hypothetical protein
MDGCSIEDDGFIGLAVALEQNSSLQNPQLAGNNIGEHGFMALAESKPDFSITANCLEANGSFESSYRCRFLSGFLKNTNSEGQH